VRSGDRDIELFRPRPHLPTIDDRFRVKSTRHIEIFRIIWDMPDDPDGNVQHIAEHGLAIEDVEDGLSDPTSEGVSASSGSPCVWGYTPEGVYIIVVYEEIDEDMIRVVTAYEVPEPR
jgi:uncharacterized DUF497 family protein